MSQQVNINAPADSNKPVGLTSGQNYLRDLKAFKRNEELRRIAILRHPAGTAYPVRKHVKYTTGSVHLSVVR